MHEGQFCRSEVTWHGTAFIHIAKVSFLPSEGSLSELSVVIVPSPHEDLVSYDLEGICDYLSSHIKCDKKHANSFTEGMIMGYCSGPVPQIV